jgi:hypothetical protein
LKAAFIIDHKFQLFSVIEITLVDLNPSNVKIKLSRSSFNFLYELSIYNMSVHLTNVTNLIVKKGIIKLDSI